MYKIKRFSLPENRKPHWKEKNDMNNLPEGASPHLRLSYSKYNAVWLNPLNNKDYMKKAHIIGFNKEYESSLNELTGSQSKRLDICLDQIESGKFLFDDDDRLIKSKNKKDDLVYFNWDTKTHWLKDKSTNDYLVYSKELSSGKRLVYEVYKPVKINEVWSCPVRICGCSYHKYGDKSYGKPKNTLESIVKYKGKDTKGQFSDTNE